ncbi:hypothetical protein [Desulfotomaculum sp. 1211_IL3151]|uniref:hypothetical protein n=1 Tax=Desulfotomaculum sp. 1211_IL3151 TaxID=3084055 RepID=UPI002FD98A40
METENDVVKFASDIREFLQTASQNGKISSEKIENIIDMLENAKQSALAQGKGVDPIQELIQELKEY